MKIKKASNGLFMIVGFLALVLSLSTGCGGGGGGGGGGERPPGDPGSPPGEEPPPNQNEAP